MVHGKQRYGSAAGLSLLSLKNRFRLLHLTSHILAAVGLIWAFRGEHYGWLLVAFLCFLYAGIVGVNISLHRFFSHNSFKTSKFGFWFLMISSIVPMLGSPAAWGSVHRFHHATSDTPDDPHNPNAIGFFRAWFTFWPHAEIPLSLYRSLVKDRRLFFLDRHWFTIVTIYILVLLIIDWRLAAFVFALPAAGCFHGAAAIATIPHMKFLGGYRNHESRDRSYNSPLAWVLSLGEGWHNNHHHAPQKFRHGEKWWELDPSAFLIKHCFMKDD